MPVDALMQDEIRRLRALYEETTPPHAGLANNVGCLLLAGRDIYEAVNWLKRATELEPMTWEFHQNLAQAQLQLGDPEAALRSLWNAREAAPGNMDAQLPLLNALFARGAIGEATDALDKFLESASLDVVTRTALRNLLNAHRSLIWSSPRLLVIWSKLESQLGMTPAAFDLIDRLLEISPNHIEGWRERGLLKANSGQLEDAVVCMRRVTELDPSDWAAWNDAGCCLRTLGRQIEAREWMWRAAASAPERAVLYANLALIDFELNDYGACASHLDDAFARDPDNPEALHTQAMLFSATGRHKDAELSDRKALAVKPDYPAARLGLALTFLTQGRLKEGFAAYESRWVGSDRADQQKQPTLGRPQWHGQAMLPGACIAVLPEQGFGDQLQFARFVPQLLERFHRVIWQVPQELLRLFQASFSNERLHLVSVIDANLARTVDVELPLLSLGLVLGIDLGNLPDHIPYLAPVPERVEYWRTRLNSFDGLKIGIAWQGRPTLSKNALRNCPVELFTKLAIPGVQLVSMQRDTDFPDAGLVLSWVDECTDFADTAALVNNLDLVISVDTALVHLAGGLGIPVWMLNRFGSEWRWMDAREDSPWYPSMKIFNQTKFQDWCPTMARVHDALAQHLSL